MKICKSVLAVVALSSLLASCSKLEPSPNEELCAQHGHEDAVEAAKLPKGSMAQEKAVLHILATEQRILETGDTAAANAYTNAAREVLDSIL